MDELNANPGPQSGGNESAAGSTAPSGVVDEAPCVSAGKNDNEGEDTSLSETADRTVPVSELRKVYKEMKKWKERYRALKAQDALLAEKDARIEELRSLISETRIDRALIDSAKEHGAIEPEQVAQFLKPNVRLGDDLSVCVVDSESNQRYSNENKLFSVDDLVREFLTQHPHHMKATQSSGSGSSRPPAALGATLVARIKNATSQKELEKIVSPKTA